LSESFSVQLGTQVKVTCNVRLFVCNSGSLFRETTHPQEDVAIRAHTVMSLYSQSLSGVIVMVPVDRFQNYCAGLGGNPEFFACCQKTTEFHFEDVDVQCARALKELTSPQPGDFFITRHSNIPNFHVVFHLLVHPKEGSSKMPLITGLQSILRVALHFDVNFISIPLLLLPDGLANLMSELSQTVRKAELVFKAIKSFLMENSGTAKNGFDNNLTFQFTLPERATADQFHAFRNKLTSVFRVN